MPFWSHRSGGCWCRGTEDAAILSVRRYRQYGVTYGVDRWTYVYVTSHFTFPSTEQFQLLLLLLHYYYYYYYRFTAFWIFPGLPGEPVPERQNQNQSGFPRAIDSEWQWHQLGHMQICTSPQTDNHASMPPLSPSVLWHCCLRGRKGMRPVKTEWWEQFNKLFTFIVNDRRPICWFEQLGIVH